MKRYSEEEGGGVLDLEKNVDPLLSLLRCVSNINHKEAKIYIFWKDELECDNKKKKK